MMIKKGVILSVWEFHLPSPLIHIDEPVDPSRDDTQVFLRGE